MNNIVDTETILKWAWWTLLQPAAHAVNLTL